jgi:hypothetical protein
MVVVTAALLAGSSGTASAQAPASPPPAGQTTTTPDFFGTTRSYWTAAGFVGTNFRSGGTDHSLDFGGEVGYLWRGVAGAELLADFAPAFKLNNALLIEDPHVHSYMANAVGAFPLGAQGQIQPYVSGGVGGIQLRTSVFTPVTSGGVTTIGTTTGDQMRLGTDIGGGVAAFLGNVGLRGDVRYYRATKDDNLSATTATGRFTQALLSGLDFWRANVGVALRW